MKKSPCFVISLDFELYFGVRDKCSLAQYQEKLLGVRKVVPALLNLFRRRGIHATWATVGFLFCESKEEMLAFSPVQKPQYKNEDLSPYLSFAHIGENEEKDPFHFALSLIQEIHKTKGQEVGSHTWSHYYCLEKGPSVEDFRADLGAAQSIAQKKLGGSLKSLVFPRNQFSPAHIEVAGQLGFSAFRGNPSSWMYHSRAQTDESLLHRATRLLDQYIAISNPLDEPSRIGRLLNVPATVFLRPFTPKLRHFDFARLKRMSSLLEYAAKENSSFHLWWHPHNFGTYLDENLQFLEKFLDEVDRMRNLYNMQSLNMSEMLNVSEVYS